jgi:hypothetical protein
MSVYRASVFGIILGCSLYAVFLLLYKQVNSEGILHFKEVCFIFISFENSSFVNKCISLSFPCGRTSNLL